MVEFIIKPWFLEGTYAGILVIGPDTGKMIQRDLKEKGRAGKKAKLLVPALKSLCFVDAPKVADPQLAFIFESERECESEISCLIFHDHCDKSFSKAAKG